MNQIAPVLGPQPIKFRIEDFEVLDRAGVFADLKKVELIEGVIVSMNAEYKPHSILKNELMFRLRLALEALGSPYKALVEATLALPPFNLPEPDVIVAAASMERDYFRLKDIAIVIEVADTTIGSDLGVKRSMYAANAVPEYWVVDVNAKQAHICWAPLHGAYGESRIVPLAGELRSATMPDLAIEGGDLL